MKIKLKRVLYLLLCILLVISIAGCGSDAQTDTEGEKNDDEPGIFETGTVFTAIGKDKNGMDIVAENDQYTLSIDPKLFTVYLTVKSTGYVWKTNLTEEELKGLTNEDTKNEYLSQLMVTYYDASNNKKVYGSYQYAVMENNPNSEFEKSVATYTIENGIRVVYQIGESIDWFLFPSVLSEDTYNSLYSMMDEETAWEFESYYGYNIYEELDDETKAAMLNTYPTLKDENLYMAWGDIALLNKRQFVKNVLLPLGWDLDKLEAEYKKLKYSYTVPDAPRFTVPMDYTLTKDGLDVNVPTELIEFASGSFRLYSLSVLPFFGSTVNTVKDGYMFIPDGSGALIDINQKTSDSIEMPFYGHDASQWTMEYAKNLQQAPLPVFGLKHDDNAFIAYVKEGSAQASVEPHLGDDIHPYAYLKSNYEIHTFETYAAEGMTKNTTLQKYCYDRYKGNINIKYNFLTKDKANYVGMAQKTRELLFAGGKDKLTNDQLQFCLETYGVVLRRDDFVGYPYNAEIALTTVNQAQSIYSALESRGVNNISLKYNNLAADEFENVIEDVGEISGEIGSTSDFKALNAHIKQAGGLLYANAELLLDEAADGMSGASSHSRLVEGSLVKFTGNGDVYMKGVTVPIRRTVHKSGYILDQLTSVFKKFDKLETGAISLSTIGETLFSDFTDNDEDFKLREAVKDDIEQILDNASKDHSVMVTAGNAYTLPYADVVVNIPLSNSVLIFETESVPFMQIVLHGYVSYFGEAINLADNNTEAFLKSVEYGAGIHYVMNFADPKMLKDTNYSHLFSTNYERWVERASEQYNTAAKILNGVQTSEIVSHKALAEGVYITGYENGTSVVVNYNNTDYTYNGKTVGAKNFIAVK